MAPVLSNLQNVANQASDSDSDDDEVTATKRSTRKTLVMESDSEEEEEEDIVMSSDEDDDDDSDEDGDGRKNSLTLDEAMGQQQQQKQKTRPKHQQRRRRRSSARFLRLSGRFDATDMEDSPSQDNHAENEQLGEMYRRAIRMNAENRINAGNSWGLRLIENIDKFLLDEEETATSPTPHTNDTTEVKRVNFTRASCTLDASVKIYSYRVDDVHLTSYKVLANLNRTDKDKSKEGKANKNDTDDTESPESGEARHAERTRASSNMETIESNLANININKLDSAYDIDPLFHKMSKTFDEGGAKGLLLANLGVGSNGCGIVFDSKQETTEETPDESEEEENNSGESASNNNRHTEEGMIDISSLTTKLKSLLDGSTTESLSLVPQLASLREEHAALEAEGFVDNEVTKKSRRYATSQEEEQEAEISIHHEALERSRISMSARASLGISLSSDNDGDNYAPDDFGGDDDEDDYAFENFVAMDENAARYSAGSFEPGDFASDMPPETTDDGPSNTTVLLDALLSGEALTQNGDYQYFDKGALEKMTGGNMWAGSAHWKKSEKVGGRKNVKGKSEMKKPKSRRKGKKTQDKKQSFVDLSCVPSLDEILKKPTTKKAKRGSRTVADPLLFPKATKTKHSSTDNLLPPDAGIGIEQLSKLFLRPNATVSTNENETKNKSKSVGFCDLEPFGGIGFDDGPDDDSYGNDDDGPGFDFADPSDGTYGAEDDFVVSELEGVRKVDKIQVGYATIAKKVDVKRLKRDLWSEIETAIVAPQQAKDDSSDEPSQTEDGENETEAGDEGAKPDVKYLSFKKTVKGLDSSQSQGDVTLPFYFICVLHLANEKGLLLKSTSLEDFTIHHDDGSTTSLGTSLVQTKMTAAPREKRKATKANTTPVYAEMSEGESSDGEEEDSASDENSQN